MLHTGVIFDTLPAWVTYCSPELHAGAYILRYILQSRLSYILGTVVQSYTLLTGVHIYTTPTRARIYTIPSYWSSDLHVTF